MAAYTGRTVVVDAFQVKAPTTYILHSKSEHGGGEAHLAHVSDWVVTYPDGTRVVLNNVTFLAAFQ